MHEFRIDVWCYPALNCSGVFIPVSSPIIVAVLAQIAAPVHCSSPEATVGHQHDQVSIHQHESSKESR